MNKIDIVIPWVDGADPTLSAKRSAFLEKEVATYGMPEEIDAISAVRWEHSDELKICLLSIEKFAPWVNNVFIITDGQEIPGYEFNSEFQRKITIIDHKVTFSGLQELLPTFNSVSIETSSINIPDLSDRYLLFNDDFFFCKPVVPEQFFDASGFGVLRGTFNGSMVSGQMWTHHRINGAMLAGFSREKMFTLAHCCQPIDKPLLMDFFDQHADLLVKNISKKFRHPDQFGIASLSAHLAIKSGRAAATRYMDWQHITASLCKNGTVGQLADAFLDLKRPSVNIGCINDFNSAMSKIDIAASFLEEMIQSYPSN